MEDKGFLGEGCYVDSSWCCEEPRAANQSLRV